MYASKTQINAFYWHLCFRRVFTPLNKKSLTERKFYNPLHVFREGESLCLEVRCRVMCSFLVCVFPCTRHHCVSRKDLQQKT